MNYNAIRLGNKLLDAIEAMSDELAPKVMNRDLDIIEECVDAHDFKSLRLFDTFLGFEWRPEGRYVSLEEVQHLVDEMYGYGVKSPEKFVTVGALDAFHSVSTKLVRFGYKQWSAAPVLAVLHPEDASLIAALVIDRRVQSWEGLSRALTAVKEAETAKEQGVAEQESKHERISSGNVQP